MGGLAAGWLVFACSFPAVLPFLFLDDPRLALRVSNGNPARPAFLRQVGARHGTRWPDPGSRASSSCSSACLLVAVAIRAGRLMQLAVRLILGSASMPGPAPKSGSEVGRVREAQCLGDLLYLQSPCRRSSCRARSESGPRSSKLAVMHPVPLQASIERPAVHAELGCATAVHRACRRAAACLRSMRRTADREVGRQRRPDARRHLSLDPLSRLTGPPAAVAGRANGFRTRERTRRCRSVVARWKNFWHGRRFDGALRRPL